MSEDARAVGYRHNWKTVVIASKPLARCQWCCSLVQFEDAQAHENWHHATGTARS